MITLVDDQLLSGYLRSGTWTDPIATTGCWYLRLCQAITNAQSRAGVLSSPIAALPEPQRSAALRAVLELPEPITLISLRELAPLVAEVRGRHRLNLLNAEALAAAIRLGARVALSTKAPLLEAALTAEGIEFDAPA